MKRLILVFAIAFSCVRCGEDESELYQAVWYVKNSTEQTLFITQPPYGRRSWNFPDVLAPGEGGVFYEFWGYLEPDEEVHFQEMLKMWGNWADENITLEVLSADGTKLIEWKLSDMHRSDKNFFLESSWRYTETFDESSQQTDKDWFFEISPADLQQ